MRPGSKNAAEDPQRSCKTEESGALLHFPVPPTFPAPPRASTLEGGGVFPHILSFKVVCFLLKQF